MLNSIELLRRLEKAGVKLALNDQEQLISLSSKASITDEIAGLIREHKSALMALLKARNAFEKPIRSRDGYMKPSAEALVSHMDLCDKSFGIPLRKRLWSKYLAKYRAAVE